MAKSSGHEGERPAEAVLTGAPWARGQVLLSLLRSVHGSASPFLATGLSWGPGCPHSGAWVPAFPGKHLLLSQSDRHPGKRGLTMEQGGAFSHHQSLRLPFHPCRHESSSPSCLQTCLQLCQPLRIARENPHPEPSHSLPSHSGGLAPQGWLPAAVSIPNRMGTRGRCPTPREASTNGQSSTL